MLVKHELLYYLAVNKFILSILLGFLETDHLSSV